MTTESVKPTLETILALKPCRPYTPSRIEALLALPPREALTSLPAPAARWVMVRLLSPTSAATLAQRAADRVAAHFDPDVHHDVPLAAYHATSTASAAVLAATDAAYARLAPIFGVCASDGHSAASIALASARGYFAITTKAAARAETQHQITDFLFLYGSVSGPQAEFRSGDDARSEAPY